METSRRFEGYVQCKQAIGEENSREDALFVTPLCLINNHN